MQMGVDSLSRGREQPFYHVLCLQPVSMRCEFQSMMSTCIIYKFATDVAEENIQQINLTQEIAKEFYCKVELFGMFFQDAQLHLEGHGDVGRLLLSPELQAAFPDDIRPESTRNLG
jgi:hypothetical protein